MVNREPSGQTFNPVEMSPAARRVYEHGKQLQIQETLQLIAAMHFDSRVKGLGHIYANIVARSGRFMSEKQLREFIEGILLDESTLIQACPIHSQLQLAGYLNTLRKFVNKDQ